MRSHAVSRRSVQQQGRNLRRAVTAGLLGVVLVYVAVPAWANEENGAPCTTSDGRPGTWLVAGEGVGVCIPDQETPGGRTPGTPGAPGEGDAVCRKEGKRIPCVTGLGVWFSSKQCYAAPMEPQPAPDDQVWGGNDPEEGTMWVCRTYDGPGTGGNWFFVPDGGTPTLVDPGELAEGAAEQMDFEYADAQIAPGPDWHTFVGIENWMWIPEDQWRVLALRVSAGGTSVTVAATPTRVQWSMGPETINCYDGGREWVAGMGEAAQTTCSYPYTDLTDPLGDTHQVSARIVYQIDWTCTGACLTTSGTLGSIRALAGDPTSIEVLQRQTVNR